MRKVKIVLSIADNLKDNLTICQLCKSFIIQPVGVAPTPIISLILLGVIVIVIVLLSV